jgi:hypothetical protein
MRQHDFQPQEGPLDDALKALAEASAKLAPSAEVETKLMAAFRKKFAGDAPELRVIEGLRELAEADAEREAGSLVEARVREGFRNHFKAPAPASEGIAPNKRLGASKHRSPAWEWMKWGSIAAGVAVAIGLGWSGWRNTGSSPVRTAEVPQPTRAAVAPTRPDKVPPIMQHESQQVEATKVTASDTREQTRPLKRPVRMPEVSALQASVASGDKIAEMNELADAEPATDFVPLMAPAGPMERGQVVRLSLPAASMRLVGLPVREERSRDRVQADVLIGDEGFPRAIRFVKFEGR